MHIRFRSVTRPVMGIVALLCLSGSFAAAQQMSPTVRTVPDMVNSGRAVAVRPMEAGASLRLTLSLPLRNQDELNALLQELYDPASPNYHQYLKVEDFTARFCPTEEDYDAVVSWARSKGFSITSTAPNRRLVDVGGSVATINRAFQITMRTYADPVSARTLYAPDREPTLDLGVQLHAIVGLTNANPPVRHYKKGAAEPIANISGSGPGNTYLPSDMRAAYYGSGPLTGQGQTVGIFSFDGYKTADLALYYSTTKTTQTVPVSNVLVGGFNGACTADGSSGTCDDGEQILDIVNVIGMAPGLTQVLFYEGSSATSVLNQMATDNKAKVLSSSWGGSDFGTASDPAFLEFQAQGQTYLNATGDSGEFNSSTYAPPSVDPNITQVGGTDLTTSGAGGAWSSETGWADSGGGFVSGTAIPSYQQLAGVINSSNKGSTTLRNAPDVAAEANFDNTTVINGTFESGYGGTSYATPRWAGFIALANQQSVANGNGTIGFLNPKIYNIGTGTSYTSDFHDIVSGNNKPSSGSGSGFNAVTGYDLVTGLGSPDGANLINALAGTSAALFTLTASPTALSIVAGSAGKTTITSAVSGGFSSAVALTASGLPTGVTASFSPASISGGAGSSTVTLTTTSSAAAGTSTVTITGAGGGLTKTVTVSVAITNLATPSFTISASPATLTVNQGSSGVTTITSTASGGFSSAVTLKATGLPTGVTASFSPSGITGTGSATLTLAASATATTGTATVTVTGAGGALTETTTVSLTVNSGAAGNQLITDGGFESATGTGLTAPGWTIATNLSNHSIIYVGDPSQAHSGNNFAALGGVDKANDTVTQTIKVTAGSTSTPLTFWVSIDTAETTKTTAYDFLYVEIHSTSGALLATPLTLSNLNSTSDNNKLGTYFQPAKIDLSAYAGETIELVFHATNDSLDATYFLIDDISVTAN